MERYRVQPGSHADLSQHDPNDKGTFAGGKKAGRKSLLTLNERLEVLQELLYAEHKHKVLVILQALDAAGKDGTVRHVFEGVNPQGVNVASFKKPTSNELDHDYLWRTTQRLPERGRIGIFNRSYYEEVLVVRVHPDILGYQKLPEPVDLDKIWKARFESIRNHEEHLARNGIVVLKFWLNVSKDEQKERFLARIEDPEKHWKFSAGDVKERGFWDKYMGAYEEAINATSRPWAPWYAIPADDKPYMRTQVANILADNLKKLDLRYPKVGADTKSMFAEMKATLEKEE